MPKKNLNEFLTERALALHFTEEFRVQTDKMYKLAEDAFQARVRGMETPTLVFEAVRDAAEDLNVALERLRGEELEMVRQPAAQLAMAINRVFKGVTDKL